MNGFPLKSEPRGWKKAGRGAFSTEHVGPGWFRHVRYRHPLRPEASALSGTRLLFFSDLHIRPQTSFSFSPRFSAWNGLDKIQDRLVKACEEFQPDYLLFGGDMLAFMSYYSDAVRLFRALKPKKEKLAVYGNWDKMRPWVPSRAWESGLESASLKLLVNREYMGDRLRFFGMDDYRHGNPEYVPSQKNPLFECVLAHNPDTVPLAMSDEDISNVDLILCGHTHGGQLRIPGFGAILTSSEHWKRFEYGLYAHETGRAKMFVSAGIGTTFFWKRLFCPPEIVMIELV